MAATKYVQVACYLTPEQHAGLKAISGKTKVPIQEYLRYAVDTVILQHKQKVKPLPGLSLDIWKRK